MLAQLDLGVLVDVDDALGRRGDDVEANLGEGESRRIEHAGKLWRDVAHLLLAGGRNEVARDHRPAEEIALQCDRRSLQAHFAVGRCENDALCRARLGLAHLDEFARADFGVAALKAVEPDDFEFLVFRIGEHRPGDRAALADDLERVAFHRSDGGERRLRQPGDAMAAFFLTGGGHLQPHRPLVLIRRCCVSHRAPFLPVAALIT